MKLGENWILKKAAIIWLDDAEYDLGSAEAMLASGKFFFVIFMCHLAIEKLLKAVIIERTETPPPRIHGLISLAAKSGVFFSEEHREIINELDDMGVVTRYPDGRQALTETLTKERATKIFKRTVEFNKWLKQELSS